MFIISVQFRALPQNNQCLFGTTLGGNVRIDLPGAKKWK